MKTYWQDGKVLDLVLAAVVASGGVVIQGKIVGVAQKAGAIGDTVACVTEGVFIFPYGVAATVSVGDTIYWDATAGNATKTSTSNTKIGVAIETAASAAATLKVKLIPQA